MPKYHCKHPGCQKFFMSEDHLEAHYRTHFGLLPFVCPFPGCGKTFSLNGNMKSHYTTHDATRCFACPFPGCEKRFKRARKLEDHTYEAHSKSLKQVQQQQQQQQQQQGTPKRLESEETEEDGEDSEGSPSSSPVNLIDVSWKQQEVVSCQGEARGKIRPRSEEAQQPELPRKHPKLVSVSTGLPHFAVELIDQFPGYPQPVNTFDSSHHHPHHHPHHQQQQQQQQQQQHQPHPRINNYVNHPGYVANVNHQMAPPRVQPGSEQFYWPTWPANGPYVEEVSYEGLYVEESS